MCTLIKDYEVFFCTLTPYSNKSKMVQEKQPTAKDYKERGNDCLKNGKYLESVLNYTFAIKLELRNAELYSNRSLAFLKSEQYYFALEDADQVIKLRPSWAKGYFRKGEVLFAAQHYELALDAYQSAFQLQPDDPNLMSCIKKVRREIAKTKTQELQMPWLGCAIGLVIGIGVIVFESLVINNVLLNHPLLQVLVIVVISITGYWLGVFVRKYMRSYRLSLLEKPHDLFGDDNNDVLFPGKQKIA